MGVETDQQRIAIGRGLGDVLRGNLAGGTGTVFHDHGTTGQLGQTRLNDARRNVRASTGRERHFQSHGRVIRVGETCKASGGGSGAQRHRLAAIQNGFFHSVLHKVVG